MKKRLFPLWIAGVCAAAFFGGCAPLEGGNPGGSNPGGSNSGGNEQGGNESMTFEEARTQLLLPEENDYRSRTVVSYDDINGAQVDVHTFYRMNGEIGNNPNFSQAVMVYQAIAYKDANPEEEVTVTLTSFHLSIVFAACVVPGSAEYGEVKNLYEQEYTDDGYYRLSYLLVEAAKKGIEVIVVGQLDGSATVQADGTTRADVSFKEYFEGHLQDDAYIAGKKVSDFMTFGYCDWTSYGDKSAADMMHNKTCTVSHRLDSDGNELGAAVWTGSINVDGIHADGRNGNDSIQTAVIVTEHEQLRRVTYNYTKLLTEYCNQEDVVPFRAEAVERATQQIAALEQGQTVAEDEQIVYLGTENDKVFELYFTPFGGDFSTWDTTHNPYVKYLSKMTETARGTEYIEFFWNNVKYTQTFALADMMIDSVEDAFRISGNKKNVLYLYLPGANTSKFDFLVPGYNVEQRYATQVGKVPHIKDVQLSYVEGGQRYWVSLFNSLNIHEGSMYHQTNTVLAVKETVQTGNGVYVDYAMMTAGEIDLRSRRVQKAD